MSNDFALALEITLAGMGLVFAMLVLLWWMMALLTAITADKEAAPSSAGADPVMEREAKARAAAIAVAFALAQEQSGVAHPLSDHPTAIVSAWQLGMRTKQLYQKGEQIKRQSGR